MVNAHPGLKPSMFLCLGKRFVAQGVSNLGYEEPVVERAEEDQERLDLREDRRLSCIEDQSAIPECVRTWPDAV